MRSNTIIIGTRGSRLALRQADMVSSEISRHFSGEIKIETIKTTGDRILDSPLSRIGQSGIFVREIELALQEGRIDLAVHSLKDMPSELPQGLMIAGVLKREDPRDAFISLTHPTLEELTKDAVVATSSLRRRAQIMHLRPGITVVDIRGNVDTRIRKLQEGLADASVMALAGLRRMGMESHISEILSPDVMLPAAGQGCIAIETRSGDGAIVEMVRKISHERDFAAVTAERALMRKLEGGCQVPIGVLAEVSGDEITLRAMVASLDGETLLRETRKGALESPGELGTRTAEELIGKGADRILQEIREKNAREKA